MKPTTGIKTYLNYIDGKWVPASTGEVEASINPANRHDVVGYVQISGRDDLEKAVAAAKKALSSWRKRTGPERGEYLHRMANVLERRSDEIAETMTREMGKTLPEAKGETARGIALLRYYAGEGMRKVGDVIPSADSGGLMFTTRVPLGVVGVITPWNFPVAIPLWKMAPALAYGNTVVFKPAEETAVTATKLVECMEEAGLPAGVVNLVMGSGPVIGQGIVTIRTSAASPSPVPMKWEGGSARGRWPAAPNSSWKWGKNPVIVLEDADLDLAVEATVSGGMRTAGQKCTATSRVFVQSAVYDPFKEKLLSRVREIQVGDGMDRRTWMGPLVSEEQLQRVLSYIRKGVEEGATLLCGGRRLEDGRLKDGFFVEPTVFEDVTPDMTIAREEIFGPVLVLIRVDTLEEALRLANDVPYGLSASIFTRDIGHMLSFIDEMDAGLVRVNAETAGVELQAPFGGMKQSSSHSREQGRTAIEFFTSIKTVFVKG